MKTGVLYNRILIVEDSKFYLGAIREMLQTIPNLSVDSAASMESALQFLGGNRNKYDLALVDLVLPDAPSGEIVDYVRKLGIPTIVFTGLYDPSLKASLFSKGIVDYVIKDSPVALEYLLELVNYLLFQTGQKVLVACQDPELRRKQVERLGNIKLSTWACDSAAETKKILAKHNDFSLVLVSDKLTDCSGIELVSALRRSYGTSQLSILAIPSTTTGFASQYLKYGANDFLRQPFSSEEFLCRVHSALKSRYQLQSLEEAATRDFLTGLLNRKAFIEAASPAIAQCRRAEQPIVLAMADIDHFKKIEDTYGNDVSDLALQAVAKALKEEARDADIVARFGGQEFCLLLPNLRKADIPALFRRFSSVVKSIKIPALAGMNGISISFGVIFDPDSKNLDQLIQKADSALHKAQNTGSDKFALSAP